MVDFNKTSIDTEELQNEITKLKSSKINSLTGTNFMKIDLEAIKSFNEEINQLLKGINNKIADLYAKNKESNEKLLRLHN